MAHQLKRKCHHLTCDLEDTRVLLENQQSRNHELEKKQKKWVASLTITWAARVGYIGAGVFSGIQVLLLTPSLQLSCFALIFLPVPSHLIPVWVSQESSKKWFFSLSQPQLCCQLTMWPWGAFFAFLGLNIPICRAKGLLRRVKTAWWFGAQVLMLKSSHSSPEGASF